MKNAVIVAYGRSPICRAFKGSFANLHPAEYSAQVLRGVLDKVPELSEDLIDDLIVGCAKPEGVQGSNFARIIAQRAGLPDCVPAQTVNRFCSSGLQSIAIAANSIMAGQAKIIIAGGAEDMTHIPMVSSPENKNKWLFKNTDVYMPMGITAENVAKKYNLKRIQMDEFAVRSHDLASIAQCNGYFNDEIIPITINNSDSNTVVISKDECIRSDVKLEKLAELKPSFIKNGIVTAATSSPLSDGAAFVVLMEEEKAKELHIKPIARFVGFSVVGLSPDIMGLGPIYAVPKVMKLTGLSIQDMDVIELNEAFAAQAIPCINELNLPIEKVNPNGGAISLGHPLGATGAILTCKAINYLKRIGGKYGLITMCIGGGMGAAGIIEMIGE